MSTSIAPSDIHEMEFSPQPRPRDRAADRIVETLSAFGVRWVFGIPGAKIDPVYDALVDSGLELILTRHEQNAAFMAQAVGRLTGTPGVALVTSGPGTSNLVTGLLTATTEGDPIVAICGAVPLADRLKRTHQSMDAVGLLASVTKSAGEVGTPDTAAEAVAEALRSAQSEPRGATAVVIPSDVALAPTTVSVEGLLPVAPLGAAPLPAITRAAELIRAAQFPVILAGARAGSEQVADALHDLIRGTDLPVVETFQAAGLINRELEDHYLGRVGLFRNQPGDVLLERADLIVAVGYDFVEYEPGKWNRDRQRGIVSIDELPAEVDDVYRPVIELRGSISETLSALAPLVSGLRLSDPVRDAIAVQRERLSAPPVDPTPESACGVSPVALSYALREGVPEDAIVCSDIGSHYIYLARHFRTYRPRSLLFSNGQQTLGVAMPWAIAATLACPDRPVVSVSGDGGFLFSAVELETAVRIGSSFTHVVFNDGTYDMVAFQQQQKYGRTSGIQLGDYDVVRFAESFGASGRRATTLAEFREALAASLAESGPSVIDVQVDYSHNLALMAADIQTEVLQ